MKPINRFSNKKHLLITSLIAAVISGGMAFTFFHFDFIPHPDSVQRQSIDLTLRILFSIGSVFFTVVVTFFAYSLIVFRRRPGDDTPGAPIRGNAGLEIAWTLIPLITVSVLSVYGAYVLNKIAPINAPPATPINGELEVDVTAFRFAWQFQYPQYGIQSFELGVPVNRPLLIRLQSRDVIHSFWVPQWGVKQDVVPGLVTAAQYTPDVIGKFQVL